MRFLWYSNLSRITTQMTTLSWNQLPNSLPKYFASFSFKYMDHSKLTKNISEQQTFLPGQIFYWSNMTLLLYISSLYFNTICYCLYYWAPIGQDRPEGCPHWSPIGGGKPENDERDCDFQVWSLGLFSPVLIFVTTQLTLKTAWSS